jgi:hypothetical protein
MLAFGDRSLQLIAMAKKFEDALELFLADEEKAEEDLWLRRSVIASLGGAIVPCERLSYSECVELCGLPF